jgi:hypothetical protein
MVGVGSKGRFGGERGDERWETRGERRERGGNAAE